MKDKSSYKKKTKYQKTSPSISLERFLIDDIEILL